MKLHSDDICNGYYADNIGNRLAEFKDSQSPHIKWEDIPSGTKSLALIFLDHDAIPVCGFSWIHWVVANIDPNLQELPHNASKIMQLLEGSNSWASNIIPDTWKISPKDCQTYGGCAPPDKDHSYIIEVYALDSILDLEPGFFMNQLLDLVDQHVIGKASIKAIYRTK